MALFSTFTLNHNDLPDIVRVDETIVFFVNFGSNFSNNLALKTSEQPLDQCAVNYAEGYVYGNNLTLTEWLYPQEEGSPTTLSALIPHLKLPKVSPLGLRVHPELGSWWSFRAVIRVKGNIVNHPFNLQDTACLECRDHPCITSCNGEALTIGNSPNMQKCFNYRNEKDSLCATRCTARIACPYGISYRYSDRLMDYLYEHSLVGIKNWLDSKMK